jgi:hypothetical protein
MPLALRDIDGRHKPGASDRVVDEGNARAAAVLGPVDFRI